MSAAAAARRDLKDLPSLPLKRSADAKPPPLLTDGKRAGGRSINDFRSIAIQTGVLGQAAGSASIQIGATQVVCSVFGPKESDSRESTMEGTLECSLRFASFAQAGGRRKAAVGGAADERELSAALHAALVGSVQLEKYPKSRVAVHAFVLQDDGAALAAAICGASLALADASILLYDLVAACGCAVHTDAVALDCSAAELRGASSEAVVAQMPSLQQLTLLRHSGAAGFDHVTEGLQLALDGCATISARMRAALVAKAEGGGKRAAPEGS